MRHKTDKKTYWVEKLSLTDVLSFSVRSRFRETRVNYDRFQAHPAAAKGVSFLEGAGLIGVFFPTELALEKTDRDGYALNYRVEKELNDCIESFITEHIPQEAGRFKDALKSYMAAVLQEKIIFITMAAWEADYNKISAGKNSVICLKGHPLNYLLRRFYRGRGFVIRKPLIPAGNLGFYLRPIYYLMCFLSCKLGGPKVRTNISKIRPSIWVEYYPSHIHAFWINKIRAQGFDVISYFDRDDTPITPKALKELEGRGSKWIDAHFPSLLRMSRISPFDFLRMLTRSFLAPFSRPAWLGAFRFEYGFLSLVYESVFTRYKVKILIQHQECSWKQGVQVLAVERAGGIMVGYHWSVFPYSRMSVENFPQHVYFAWGRMMGELLGKKDIAGRRILPSGIWGAVGGKGPEGKPLFAEDVDFVISVFDSLTRYNLCQSPGSLSDFYIRVLNIVKDNPCFGCVIKSKQPYPQSILALPWGSEIIGLAEILKGRKKLVIFESYESPVAAASYSDLSVGYTINSACAVVASLGDHAAINWDCSGFKKHPFYKDPGQKIVFGTLDELEGAILKASKGDKTVGDYGRWRKDINYFGDQRGIDRVAGFLESYMKESIDTGDPCRSLDLAVRKYLENNKVGEDFYQKEGLWEDE